MLLNLHVKNLALIEEADVEFRQGLNILTGETGAGKSIIIGSINIALGQKASKDMIRQGCECAYIELVFQVEDNEKRKELNDMEVFPDDDGILIISKKIMLSRSISKINDETVTAGKLKQVTSLLIDIHGQHEHQSLLYHSKHLEILDEYAKSRTNPLKQNIADAYREYGRLKEKLAGFTLDQESRMRQADFCRFEIDEIENAALRPGEEEELTAEYRRFSNGQKIMESLRKAYEAVNRDNISRVLRAVEDVADLDTKLKEIKDQLYDIDAILDDAAHSITDYLDSMTFDEEELKRVEERLDLIRGLQAKYGNTILDVLSSLEEKKRELEELENYDLLRQRTEKEFEDAKKFLDELCGKLSVIRQEAAGHLTEKIKKGLCDLNFLDTAFTMEFKRLLSYTASGYDEAEFMISTNPGEPVRPLVMVASGGELSRIMLAIKAVLADTDDIPSLIFDEIDTGISGRTAQKVSEKLNVIAGSHQVICITHLPQIAAMGDAHFEIAKMVEGGKTRTEIRELNRDESVRELARLLGGVEITDTVLENAGEMLRMAEKAKSRRG